MQQLRLRTAPIRRTKSKGRRRIRSPCAQSHSVTEEIRAASPISGRRIVSTLAWRFLGKWDGDPSSTRLTRLQHRRTSCSVGVIERTHRMTPHGCCTTLPLLASQEKKGPCHGTALGSLGHPIPSKLGDSFSFGANRWRQPAETLTNIPHEHKLGLRTASTRCSDCPEHPT